MDRSDIQNLLDILPVHGLSKESKRALHQAVRSKAINSSEELWIKWIKEGSGLFDILPTLIAIERIQVTKRSAVSAALKASVDAALGDRGVLKRWKAVLSYTNVNATEHALTYLLDQMPQRVSPQNSISDLRFIGDVERFLEKLTPAWAPFLVQLIEYEDGRAWIKQNASGVAHSFASSIQKIERSFTTASKDFRATNGRGAAFGRNRH